MLATAPAYALVLVSIAFFPALSSSAPESYRTDRFCVEIVDATAAAAYSPRNQAAQKAAGGTSFRTTGKIIRQYIVEAAN